MQLNNIKKLHGAEHAIYNFYRKKNSLNNWSYNRIKNESRIVNHCGTTQYILIAILIFIEKLFIDDFFIRYLIAIGISNEIIRISDNKFFNILFKPLFFISGIIQKYLYTAQPDDIHIDMAIESIEKLGELENNYKKEK